MLLVPFTGGGLNAVLPDMMITDDSTPHELGGSVQTDENRNIIYTRQTIDLLIASSKVEFIERKTVIKNGIERSVQSSIWNTFRQIVDKATKSDVSTWFICTQCNEPVQNKHSGSTTTFHRHNNKCRAIGSEQQRKVSDFFAAERRKPTIISEKHKEMIRESAVRFVCEDLRPYIAIEGNGLMNLMQASFELGQAYPQMTNQELQAVIPSRSTVQRSVGDKSVEAKAMITKKLREAIKIAGGFASTVDLWSDKYRQRSYMSITAHTNTLNDKEIVADRFVIAMIEIEEESKTMEICEREMLAVFSEYGICEEEVRQCIDFVTDRGSQFKAMHNIRRSNCFAHLLNNIVQSICKENIAATMISDTAALVRYVKKAGLNYRAGISLKSYCPTRWNTVHTMFRSVEHGYDVIYNLLERRQNSGKPAHRNCIDRIECIRKSTLVEIANFLEPFKQWTDRLEGDKEVTIDGVWPTFVQLHEHIAFTDDEREELDSIADQDNNSGGRNIVIAMKQLAQNYIDDIKDDIMPTKNQRIGTVLNPQMKKLKRMKPEERDQVYREVNEMIRDRMQTSTRQIHSQRNTSSSLASFESFIDSETEDDESSLYCAEFSAYLNQRKPTKDFNLRAFWFDNRHCYPNLFKLFMRISCIPACSSPAERSFSTTGAVVTDRRSSMLPKSVGDIILCRNLYQQRVSVPNI